MNHPCSKLLFLSLVWCACRLALATDEPTYAGQPLSEVLHALQREGLHFIYNSQLVAADLRVQQEPRARAGAALAREVLAQHDLALSEVAPQVYAIVRQPRRASRFAEPKPPESKLGPTLEEVVVQASRYTLAPVQPNASHTFLTHDQLTALPRLGDETLRTVQRLPGASANGFSSLAAIRGGDPSETAILLDGLRLYEPFHFKNFLQPVSLLDSRALSQVDVYAGGFPVEYGERMSAVVDAHSVHPTGPAYRELGLSLFHASGLFSTAFDDDRARVLVSARRSNLGELAQLSETDFGKPTYADGFLRLDYQAHPATVLRLNMLGSHDRITAQTSSQQESSRAEYHNYYSWGTLTHQWPRAGTSQVMASYTRVSNERSGRVDDPGHRVAQVRDFRKFQILGLRVDHRFPEMSAFEHRTGAEVRSLDAAYSYRSDVAFEAGYPFPEYPATATSRRTSLQPDGSESMAYWDTRWHFMPQWTLAAGLRVETQTYDHSGDSAQWSPRVNVLFELSPRTRWRASWGIFQQAQAINELQVEDGVESFYRAQRAEHAILSFEHTFGDRLDLRIEAYQKDYDDPTPHFENALDPLKLLPEAEFDRVRVAPESARVRGAEVLLNLRETRGWSAWLGYAWARAEDRIDGRNVPRSWDQRHAVTAGLRWSRAAWDLAITDSYHSGWPTTPVRMSGATAVLGRRNTERLGAFNSLDFRLTRTLQLSRGHLDVFLEATNLLSRKNPCCSEYSFEEGDEPQLVRETDEWLPLVPSFGVLWRY